MKIFSKISFPLIGLLYIIIVGGLCHILPIPEIVKGFLALPGFLIIPYLIGNIFITSSFLNENSWQSKLSVLFVLWVLGLILLTVVAMILDLFSFFNFFYYLIGIFIIIVVKILFDEIYVKKYNSLYNLTQIVNLIRQNYKDIATIILITLLPLILVMGLSPFPTIMGDDTFRFCTGSQQILHHSLIPREIGYFPFLSIIVASISMLFNIHPHTLFWTGTFLSYFVYGFGIYILGYQISKNKQFSLIVVLFAVFPFYIKTMCLYRFIPQTWIYFTFPFVVLVVNKILEDSIKTIKAMRQKHLFVKFSIVYFVISVSTYFVVTKLIVIAGLNPITKIFYFVSLLLLFIISFSFIFGKTRGFMASIVLSAAIFLHHPMGVLVVVLLMTYVYLRYFLSFLYVKNRKYYSVMIYGFVFLLAISIPLQLPSFLTFSTPYDMSYYTFGEFSVKADLLTYAFSYMTFAIFVIGIIYLSLIRHNQVIDASFLILSLLSLFIYFVSSDMLIRILPMFAVFSVYVSAHGFFWIKYQLSSYKKNIFLFPLMVLMILPLLFSPILHFIDDAKKEGSGSNHNLLSSFTYNEYKASLWIEKNVPNAIIISDPWTQLVVSGLSGIQNIGEVNGGDKIKNHIKKIFGSSSSDEAYNLTMLILSQKLTLNYSEIKEYDFFTMPMVVELKAKRFDKNLDLTKKDALIVVTPRSIEYAKSPYLWYPSKTKSFLTRDQFPITSTVLEEYDPLLIKFYDNSRFELIYYEKGEVYIFKVKQHSNQKGNEPTKP